jgi:hypothetical protein
MKAGFLKMFLAEDNTTKGKVSLYSTNSHYRKSPALPIFSLTFPEFSVSFLREFVASVRFFFSSR